MPEGTVGVLGATCMVGHDVLNSLVSAGWNVLAFTRKSEESLALIVSHKRIKWICLDQRANDLDLSIYGEIKYWICAAPVWVVSQYFPMMTNAGVERLVVVSSTSVFTKAETSDILERDTVNHLQRGEREVINWAQNINVKYIIMRPTLIYGHGKDKNIAEIARLARRLRFFPMFGNGSGLRQPVHSIDVASACVSSLSLDADFVGEFNLSGGQTLSYEQMVTEVFHALGLRPRIMSIPLWLFSVMVTVLHIFPKYRKWNLQMALRMNKDMVFDNSSAREMLGFSPRVFNLEPEDLPQ